MTGNKLLEKFTDRVALPDEPETFADDVDDLGAFGFLRGLHERSVTVALRRRSGEIMAVGYAFIDRMMFDASEGITLFCGGRSIRIEGKNLNKDIRPQVSLFQGLILHRVPWIAEADQAAMLQAGGNAVIIKVIEW